MSDTLTFSVVVSTRDRGAMIEPALRSLMAVLHPAFDVIVVDQSSDSLTEVLVRTLAADDSRIRYVHSELTGLSRGRNVGIALSHGDIVAFTDDDCVVDPDWLNAIETEMLDMAVGGVFGRVLPNEYRGRTGIDLAFKDSQVRVEYAGRAIPWHVGHGANMAFRRTDLVAVGGFDEILGAGGHLPSHEDGDMTYRVLACGRRVVFTPSSLVYHRQWRDWDERKRTERSYGLGAGGQFMKYVRCGDITGLRLFAKWMWQLGVRRLGAGLLKWRSRKVMYLGFSQLIYPWVGAWRSLVFGVDPAYRIYVGQKPTLDGRPLGHRLDGKLSDRTPVASSPELAAEASESMEQR
jgi:GT2 family glycosyltransferase